MLSHIGCSIIISMSRSSRTIRLSSLEMARTRSVYFPGLRLVNRIKQSFQDGSIRHKSLPISRNTKSETGNHS